MAKLYVRKSDGTYVPQKLQSVTNIDIVQTTGDSQDKVMSQKAVTDTLTVSDQKLSELKEKVDALALGKFYGYFPDSTSLPTDVITPGYSYVGLDNPYKIWNFNGESWSDSGTSIDMNDTDEEDITRNVDGKLQFKDRSYGDGMGYIILRKDKTFAEQVIKENTIYEIRYNFIIGGSEKEPIKMPFNSVLKFTGGSLINGYLQGNNTRIECNTYDYIFNKIVFSGSFISTALSINNFGAVSNTILEKNVFTYEYDSTEAFQDAVSSGFNIFIPCGAYYLSKSIIIDKPITITAEGIIPDYSYSDINFCNKAVIYTNKAIVLFDIRKRINWSGGLITTKDVEKNIGDVIVFNFNISFTALYTQIDTHIIGRGYSAGSYISDNPYDNTKYNIETGYNTIAYNFDLKSSTQSVYSAEQDNVIIKGLVSNAKYGLYIPRVLKTARRYCTGIKALFNTSGCKYAHYIESGFEITIGGSHQNTTIYDTEEDTKNGYTYINGATEIREGENLKYWDFGNGNLDSNLNKYSGIIAFKIERLYDWDKYTQTSAVPLLYVGPHLQYLLDTCNNYRDPIEVPNECINSKVKQNVSITPHGPTTLGYGDSFNYRLDGRFDNQFINYKYYPNTIQVKAYKANGENIPDFTTLSADQVLKSLSEFTQIQFNDNFEEDSYLEYDFGDYYIYSPNSNIVLSQYISLDNSYSNFKAIEVIDSSGNVIRHADAPIYPSNIAANRFYLTNVKGKEGSNLKIRLVGLTKLNSKKVYFTIANLYPQFLSSSCVTLYSDNPQTIFHGLNCNGPIKYKNNTAYTEYCKYIATRRAEAQNKDIVFDITYGKQKAIFKYDNNFYESDGEVADIPRHGKISQVPDKPYHIGFRYFATDIVPPRPIYWTGSTWVDGMGNKTFTLKGTTSQRPVLDSSDEGFKYYDSTLKKYILWNGAEWVNLDGTSL